MDIQILIWINTAIIIFAVIVIAITMRASWADQRQTAEKLSTDMRHIAETCSRMERISLATLERVAAAAPRAS